MKTVALIITSASMFFFSCTKENINDTPYNFKFSSQVATWKSLEINQEFADKQQNISHYKFDGDQVKKKLIDTAASYVWFDIGVNTSGQITLALTTADVHNKNIISTPSQIVLQNETDFTIEMLSFDIATASNGIRLRALYSPHFISNEEAFQFIKAYRKPSVDFQAISLQGEDRVERFGIAKEELIDMLSCPDVKDLTVFWGVNSVNKLTTVIGTVDDEGTILINKRQDTPCGSFRDFTRPCPTECSPTERTFTI